MENSRIWAIGATIIALTLIAAVVFVYVFRSLRAGVSAAELALYGTFPVRIW